MIVGLRSGSVRWVAVIVGLRSGSVRWSAVIVGLRSGSARLLCGMADILSKRCCWIIAVPCVTTTAYEFSIQRDRASPPQLVDLRKPPVKQLRRNTYVAARPPFTVRNAIAFLPQKVSGKVMPAASRQRDERGSSWSVVSLRDWLRPRTVVMAGELAKTVCRVPFVVDSIRSMYSVRATRLGSRYWVNTWTVRLAGPGGKPDGEVVVLAVGGPQRLVGRPRTLLLPCGTCWQQGAAVVSTRAHGPPHPGWARFASSDSQVTRIRLGGLSQGDLTSWRARWDWERCHRARRLGSQLVAGNGRLPDQSLVIPPCSRRVAAAPYRSGYDSYSSR